MIRVAALSLEQLEDRAQSLLKEYAETADTPVTGAIPVEEIAMYHLALRLESADLHDTLRIPMRGDSPDILGAIFFDQNAILIDQSLDPETHPSQLGRYRFSIGHEIGHWVLHRSVVLKNQTRHGRPAIVCRQSEGTRPLIEWQAENFSSFLLLPRHRVRDAWGCNPPFVFDVHEHGSSNLRRAWLRQDADPMTARSMFLVECDGMFDQLAGPLAQQFQVSRQAMRIRLEGMGLLHRARQTTRLST
jgi:Zn-dependent peptidase ImmA (M78 family)